MRIMISAIALALLATHAVAEAPATPEARTLVTVNDRPLTELHYALFRNQRGGGDDISTPQAQVALLNQLVNTAMLADAATSEGLESNAEVMAAIEVAKLRVLAEVALRNHLNTHPVTDEEVQKAFDARGASGPTTEYKARHILVETEDKAKELIKQLDGGADFAELAKANSTGPTGPNGGDLGWFEAKQMVEPFAAALIQLEKGKYTSTPVQTRFGWHVILAEDQRSLPAPKLEDLRQELTTELQRQRISEYVTGVREKAKIEIEQPPANAGAADGAAAAPAVDKPAQ